MTDTRDVRKQVEHLIERAQHEILEASRELADGISKETERFVPPFSNNIEQIVDDVFDFAERVIKGQRRMVSDVAKTINDQTDRAAQVGRTTTRRVTKRAEAVKKAVAKRAPAKKAPAKRAPAKKAPAKKAPAKKAPAKMTGGGQ